MAKVSTPRSGTARNQRPLWTCPMCGNRFVNRNSWHSCGRWPLDSHFQGRPRARALFDRLLSAIKASGPVRVVPQRTRICFMTRVRFTGVQVRKDWLRAGLWLKRRASSSRVVAIEQYTPRDFGHFFEIRQPADIDAELRKLLREARAVGDQKHLNPTRSRKAPKAKRNPSALAKNP